jgi:hypothetical protein
VTCNIFCSVSHFFEAGIFLVKFSLKFTLPLSYIMGKEHKPCWIGTPQTAPIFEKKKFNTPAQTKGSVSYNLSVRKRLLHCRLNDTVSVSYFLSVRRRILHCRLNDTVSVSYFLPVRRRILHCRLNDTVSVSYFLSVRRRILHCRLNDTVSVNYFLSVRRRIR